MTPQQAVQYLAQIATDYANSLPLSVRGPFVQAAQGAVDTVRKALPEDHPHVPS